MRDVLASLRTSANGNATCDVMFRVLGAERYMGWPRASPISIILGLRVRQEEQYTEKGTTDEPITP
jgi:hypothetical protein